MKFPSRTASFFANRAIPIAAITLFTISFACDYRLLATGLSAGMYTSDGFHYWSFVRNLFGSNSFYEGPTFEYLLGNHAYLILVIIAPLIVPFGAPLALGAMTVIATYATCFLGYKVSRKFGFSSLASALIASSYLVFPMVVQTGQGMPYLFQPDYLAPPLLLGIFWAWMSRNYAVSSLLVLLLVFVKEEWIIWTPFVLFFFGTVLGFEYLKKIRTALPLALAYVAGSIISIYTLDLFGRLNKVKQVPRLSFGDFAHFELRPSDLGQAFAMFLPVLLVATIAFVISGLRMRPAVILLTVIAITAARFLLSMSRYGNLVFVDVWATHSLLSPVWLITIVASLALIRTHSFKSSRRRTFAVISIPVLLSLTLCFQPNWVSFFNKAQDSRLALVSSIAKSQNLGYSNLMEAAASEVANLPDRNSKSYFVTDEYLMNDFMFKSHISTGWLVSQPNSFELLSGASFAVIHTDNAPIIELLKSHDWHLLSSYPSIDVEVWSPQLQ